MDMVSLKQSKNYGCGSYMRVVVLTDNSQTSTQKA